MPISSVKDLLLEGVCWDKDRFGKDYLGEFDCSIEEMFVNGQAVQEVYSEKEIQCTILEIVC